jgi:DNA-binding NtrC family response regulator
MNETAACAGADPRLAFVIDDDARVSAFVAAALSEQGIGVESFQTAKAALNALDRADPAVIFLDVALLQSDAIDVLRGLGERQYRGVVQLMSGGNLSLLQAVQRIGVRHRVTLGLPLRKPVSREAIAQVIASIGFPTTLPQPETTAAIGPASPGRE